jgi:hypothetical protein
MIEHIKVRPSLIPPDLAGLCTVCLHEDNGIWRKTYRSQDEALIECELLGLTSAEVLSFDSEPLIATVRRKFLPEAVVDLSDLERRGYQK